LPEPGGTFTGRVSVTNTGTEAVTLIALADEDLNGVGTCIVPQTLMPGATYSCTFPIVFTGNAHDTKTIRVTATVVDAAGRQLVSTDSFVLTLADVVPTLAVTKTADSTTRSSPGGRYTYRVTVTNTSNESVTIIGLVDDVHGDLNGTGTCAVGTVLPAAGGTYRCSFEATFTGVSGDRQTDKVTATVVDDDTSTGSASSSATVAISSPPPVTTPPSVAPVATVPLTVTGPMTNPGLVGLPSVGRPLARTGTGITAQVALGAIAVLAGAVMLAMTWPRRAVAASPPSPGFSPRRRRLWNRAARHNGDAPTTSSSPSNTGCWNVLAVCWSSLEQANRVSPGAAGQRSSSRAKVRLDGEPPTVIGQIHRLAAT